MPAYRLSPPRPPRPDRWRGVAVFAVHALWVLAAGVAVTVVAHWFGHDLYIWQGIVIVGLFQSIVSMARH